MPLSHLAVLTPDHPVLNYSRPLPTWFTVGEGRDSSRPTKDNSHPLYVALPTWNRPNSRPWPSCLRHFPAIPDPHGLFPSTPVLSASFPDYSRPIPDLLPTYSRPVNVWSRAVYVLPDHPVLAPTYSRSAHVYPVLFTFFPDHPDLVPT